MSGFGSKSGSKEVFENSRPLEKLLYLRMMEGWPSGLRQRS
jgi:hypothetical protein